MVKTNSGSIKPAPYDDMVTCCPPVAEIQGMSKALNKNHDDPLGSPDCQSSETKEVGQKWGDLTSSTKHEEKPDGQLTGQQLQDGEIERKHNLSFTLKGALKLN